MAGRGFLAAGGREGDGREWPEGGSRPRVAGKGMAASAHIVHSNRNGVASCDWTLRAVVRVIAASG